MLTVCVVIGLCASLAECTIRPREAAQSLSTMLHKRQTLERSCSDERYNEILRNLPDDCVPILTSLDAGTCTQQCFSIGCSDTCAQPLYDYYVECYDDRSRATVWEVFCSRDGSGDFCYNVFDEIVGLENTLTCYPSICTSTCVEAYEAGCCLYSTFAVQNSVESTSRLWDSCDVDIPGVCTSRFTGEPIKAPGSGEATLTSYISVLVVAVLIASTTLN